MSLKFGIYLVEQRIVSPEQFCGLVKVQQEAMMSVATIAIRKNMLTINQVARILDLQEASPNRSFLQVAVDNDFMDDADAHRLQREQELSCPTIRKLVVECGLLTERQSAVLFHHFEKRAASTTAAPTQTPQKVQQPATQQPAAQPATNRQQAPPRPKFRQKPVIVNPYAPATQQPT